MQAYCQGDKLLEVHSWGQRIYVFSIFIKISIALSNPVCAILRLLSTARQRAGFLRPWQGWLTFPASPVWEMNNSLSLCFIVHFLFSGMLIHKLLAFFWSFSFSSWIYNSGLYIKPISSSDTMSQNFMPGYFTVAFISCGFCPGERFPFM